MTMPASGTTVKGLFDGLQQEMAAKLSANRIVVQHEPSKGAVSERSWISLLTEYLPKRYSVDTAFILDLRGNISEQIDVVIFDRQYSTFLLNREGLKYVPAESVYAVFEAKQVLDARYLRYASEKISSVRNLHRTNAPHPQSAGFVAEPREPAQIIGGYLATDCDWSPPFGDTFQSAIEACDSIIDIGCVINSGTFVWNNELQQNQVFRQNILVSFYFGLLSKLQSMGTVPAIKFDEYLGVLEDISE